MPRPHGHVSRLTSIIALPFPTSTGRTTSMAFGAYPYSAPPAARGFGSLSSFSRRGAGAYGRSSKRRGVWTAFVVLVVAFYGAVLYLFHQHGPSPSTPTHTHIRVCCTHIDSGSRFLSLLSHQPLTHTHTHTPSPDSGRVHGHARLRQRGRPGPHHPRAAPADRERRPPGAARPVRCVGGGGGGGGGFRIY